MARRRAPLDCLKQAGQVLARLKTEPPGWRRERPHAVRLGQEGELGRDQIAAAVGRARSILQQWFDRYRAGGIGRLLELRRGQGPPSALTPEHARRLAAGLQAGRWRTGPEVHRFLVEELGLEVGLGAAYKYLGKAGARLRVPRPSHVKKDPAAGFEFRTGLAAKLHALALPANRPVRLWVLDEMRYGLHGFTRRVGGLPGHRPVAPARQVYQWGYLYGAVGVGHGRTQFLLAETVDRPHLRAFYRQIAQSDPAAVHVLIQDGAGFHLPDGHADLPDNVRVVTLPAYSPELNPVEGLWDQLRDQLCNRVFATLAELEAHLGGLLAKFWADARRVRSLVFGWLRDQANASSASIIPV